MIIDFHTHPWMPRRLNAATEAFIRGISPAIAQHGDRLEDPAFAADVLRSEGVRRAVVLPEHCPETSGNVRTEHVLGFCAAAPDFYLPFASINPNLDPDPPALLAAYIDAGARGLKIYPSYQFFTPDEERLYPIYDACQTAGKNRVAWMKLLEDCGYQYNVVTAGQVVVTVTLSRPADATVTIEWTTVDGTAVAGDDYLAATGTITILAGQQSGSAVIDLIDDGVEEADEYFTVAITAISGSSAARWTPCGACSTVPWASTPSTPC